MRIIRLTWITPDATVFATGRRGRQPVDLVLIEGYKRERHPKIEAYRAEPGNELIAPGDASIRAVASDVALDLDRPVFDLNDTVAIADFILKEVGL